MPPRQVKGPIHPEQSELTAALASCRGAFLATGLISGISNVLMLTGAVFMLEIYDRVLPSRSVPTLIGIAILAGGLYVVQGILDLIRSRVLVRIGGTLDEAVSGRVFDTILRLPTKVGKVGDGLQPLRDLDSVRSFLSGLGPIALFDLPWLPLYIGICYLLHPWLGYTALGGAIILVAFTLVTEMLTRRPTKAAANFAASRSELAQAGHRNAEAIVAMGMVGRMVHRWAEANRQYMAGQWSASDVVGGLGAVSKVLRLLLQSAMLGVGAFLVIHQEATAGIIIAGSILAARALAPVDLAIAHWKAFAACRQSWQRLNKLLALLPPQQMPMLLPAPREKLTVESASTAPPASSKLVLQDISFKLERGSGLGVIGPTGSGKSSLARLLVGVWQPARGKVRLDGCTFDQWSSEVLGAHIGYLPQDGLHAYGKTLLEEARNAFSEAMSIRREMDSLEHQMTIVVDHESDEYHKILDRYGELQHRFQDLDGFSIDSNCAQILTGLGFKDSDFEKPVVRNDGHRHKK